MKLISSCVVLVAVCADFVVGQTSTSNPTSNMTDTLEPSELPTMSPSSMPTTTPSSMPSSTPTSTFTSMPTPAPTSSPTSSPEPTPFNMTESPTAETISFPTFSPIATLEPTSFLRTTVAQECSAHPACAMLIDDCCPTKDDIFLYCCFESDEKEQYGKEFGFIASDNDQAEYFVSTSTYTPNAEAPDGAVPVIYYSRNASEVYDLIYFTTTVITNASDYVEGSSKFYIDLYSTAPPCTQVLLQLDNLAAGDAENYPIGRHSRYVAQTTVQNEWERLEFDFLDRPDETLGDDQVDSIALFFGPGTSGDDEYYFRNLDSSLAGCVGDCESPAPKYCSALLDGEAGSCGDGEDNDNDGLVDCEDSECTLDALCTVAVRSAYSSAKFQLRSVDADDLDSGANHQKTALFGAAVLISLFALL